MLPPVNPAVLERNPRFKVLYQDLSSTRLNPDGTSRVVRKQRAQEDVKKALQTKRIERAKEEIVKNSLASLASRSVGQLPADLQEVIRIVSALLDGRISEEDREILEDDVEYLLENAQPVNEAISTDLESTAIKLAAIVNAGSKPHSSESLSTTISTLQTLTTQTRNEISTTHTALTNLHTTISSTHALLLESLVRALEQTVHGVVARGTRARAEHLATVARGMELKVGILAASASSLSGKGNEDPKLQEAMGRYENHLRGEFSALRAREREGKARKREYEDVGDEYMRRILERYRGLCKEVEEVEGEIARVGGGGE
ncbi:hypothetical protein K402DRAFT_452276 [Aulographum hederae CBS 113979]|uniref:Uncharacterized protein n=1 Tax=Aulographum hederae CBS 113979 TaxID=1176131 RepID=A0A6G1H7Q8_9PEZI|nr:hypothetical protein K402DRAFT_452276 [Aulographum hederae CBS 113979]